jgi:putative licD1 protein
MASDEALIDPELLHRIQALLLKMLADFDDTCRRLDIPYVVYGGTAIGAVRHHGFIPWDDDVDVLMTRADYERFLKEAPDALPEGYQIDNTRTRPDFPFMFTKLGLKGTLLVPEFGRDSKYRMPISLDVLPVDNVPDDSRAARSMSRSTWLWGRLLYVQGTPTPYLIGIKGLRRVAIHTATSAAHWAMRLLRVTPRTLQARWDRAARRYEDTPTRRMADFSMRDPWNWAVTTDDLYPALEVPFEDITVKLARNYDKLLRRSYGDYMQLPPEEQRRNHKPCVIDFGPYETTGS